MNPSINDNAKNIHNDDNLSCGRTTPSHRGVKLDTRGIKNELRQDYLRDSLVIIAPNRGSRPYDTKDFGHTLIETAKSPNLDENKFVWQLKNHKGWKVKVVENKFPSLSLNNPRAFGKQEVVIDTPRANVSFSGLDTKHIEDIFRTYIVRSKDLLKQNGIKYVLVFKNDGYESGASLAHAHSQIFALPLVPQKYQHESDLVEAYVKENKKNPFDAILEFEINEKVRIVSNNKNWFVFCPYASQWPFELWFLPKRHLTLSTQLNDIEIEDLAKLVKLYTKKLHSHDISYNMFLQNGVSKNHRFCLKLCGRSNIWGGLEVATEIVINTVPPESAAKWYKS